MATQMERSPPPVDESDAPTTLDAVQDTNQFLLPEEQLEQLEQLFIPFHSPKNRRQAISCLRLGIEIESIETLWHGICRDLWIFDSSSLNTLSKATSEAVFDMNFGMNSNERRFDCPVFVAEARNGWPRTCNNYKGMNMADVRRHLTDRPGRGYSPQLAFLKLCRTCNNDFINKEVFESQHGYYGELCNNRRPGRRKAKAKEQWELLYRQVEEALSSQHVSTQRNESESVLPRPGAEFPVPSIADGDIGESRGDDSLVHNQVEAMPYVTPYQLIVESDSDEGELTPESQHAPSPVSNWLNQPPASRAWDKNRPFELEFSDRDPWSSFAPRNEVRTRESDAVEGHSQPNPSEAPLHDLFSQSSKATPPPKLDTARSQPNIPIQEDGSFDRTQRAGFQRYGNTQPDDAESEKRTDSYESMPFSTTDPDEESFGSSYWTSARSDNSPSSYYIYPGPDGIWGTWSSDQSRGFSRPTSDSIPNQPLSLLSVVTSIPNEEAEHHSSVVSCSLCEKSFTGKYRRGNLGRHMRHAHGREALRRFNCKMCGRQYARSDALAKHMRMHHCEDADDRDIPGPGPLSSKHASKDGV